MRQTNPWLSSIEEGPEPEEVESDVSVFNISQTAICKSQQHKGQSQKAQGKNTPCGKSDLPPFLTAGQ